MNIIQGNTGQQVIQVGQVGQNVQYVGAQPQVVNVGTQLQNQNVVLVSGGNQVIQQRAANVNTHAVRVVQGQRYQIRGDNSTTLGVRRNYGAQQVVLANSQPVMNIGAQNLQFVQQQPQQVFQVNGGGMIYQ